MSHALPNLLFNECHKSCVDSEVHLAYNPEQITCISNCQDKVYKAFDIYMAVLNNSEQRKSYRDYVDISRFTGMEVEHRDDTANELPHHNDLHVNTAAIKSFSKMNQQGNSDLIKKALD
jgi:hypothetical protein